MRSSLVLIGLSRIPLMLWVRLVGRGSRYRGGLVLSEEGRFKSDRPL